MAASRIVQKIRGDAKVKSLVEAELMLMGIEVQTFIPLSFEFQMGVFVRIMAKYNIAAVVHDLGFILYYLNGTNCVYENFGSYLWMDDFMKIFEYKVKGNTIETKMIEFDSVRKPVLDLWQMACFKAFKSHNLRTKLINVMIAGFSKPNDGEKDYREQYVATIQNGMIATLQLVKGMKIMLNPDVPHTFGNLPPKWWPKPNEVYTVESVVSFPQIVVHEPLTFKVSMAVNLVELNLRDAYMIAYYNDHAPVYHLGYAGTHFIHAGAYPHIMAIGVGKSLN